MSVFNASRHREIFESLSYWMGAGRVFYVGVTTDTFFEDFVQDKFDGQVASTLADALNKCEAGRGDTIVLLPGTYTLTAPQIVSLDDVVITGIPGKEYGTVIVGSATAADDVISVTGDDVTIANLTLRPNNSTAFGIALSGARCLVENVVFDALVADASGIELRGAVARIFGCRFFSSSATIQFGISFSGVTGTNAWIKDCVFDCLEAGGGGSDLDDSGAGGIIIGLLVEGCRSLTPASEVPINMAAFDHEGLISDCRFALAVAATADLALNAGAALRWVKCGTEEGVPDTAVSDRPN